MGEHESLSTATDRPQHQASNVVVSSLDGVTWVRRSAGAITIRPPDLDARIVRVLDGLSLAGTSSARLNWLLSAAGDADFVFLFGPCAADVAQAISAVGNGHRVVMCGSNREAERAARILALPGDTVLQEPDCIVLYPGAASEMDPAP